MTRRYMEEFFTKTAKESYNAGFRAALEKFGGVGDGPSTGGGVQSPNEKASVPATKIKAPAAVDRSSVGSARKIEEKGLETDTKRSIKDSMRGGGDTGNWFTNMFKSSPSKDEGIAAPVTQVSKSTKGGFRGAMMGGLGNKSGISGGEVTGIGTK